MSKIKCTSPDHNDNTPSMEVYPDWLHCFVCGHRERNNGYEVKEKEPEDVKETIKYILGLPKKTIRGLDLHTTDVGYYIVWPDQDYYKLRTFSGIPRYIGPTGTRAPLYVTGTGQRALVIIEGEVNTISLQQAGCTTGVTACSPGSASEFSRHLDKYLSFGINSVIMCVDKDPAGVAAGMELKKEFLKRGKRVLLIGLEKDFNDLLQHHGTEAVKEVWEKEVGMFLRV